MSYAAAQIDRILANLVRFGRVTAVAYSQAIATVDFDGELVEGIEWLKQRAGDDRSWSAPSKDEYVLVLSASGDLSQGVILGALEQTKFPNVGTDANPVTVYSDGTTIQYDKNSHVLNIQMGSGGKVVISGNVEVTGNITATGDVKAGSVSLKNHKHGGIYVGGSLTQVPQQ